MRRQLDAVAVDLDSQEGIARYALGAPRILDPAEMSRAVHSAGYTLVTVQLEVSGKILRESCAQCDAEVAYLELDGTGQRFELFGEIPAGGRVQVHGPLEGWDGPHPRLRVEAPPGSP